MAEKRWLIGVGLLKSFNCVRDLRCMRILIDDLTPVVPSTGFIISVNSAEIEAQARRREFIFQHRFAAGLPLAVDRIDHVVDVLIACAPHLESRKKPIDLHI